MSKYLHPAGDNAEPPTYFASPQRSTPSEIVGEIQKIGNSPLLDAALHGLGGWVCVLNKHRQVLAINHTFLIELGISDPAAALGLRPGEALQCVHAHDHTAGCGTSRFCRTCGAAVSIVAAQQNNQPQQLECVITIEKDGLLLDRDFMVNCTPFQLDDEELLLVCMRDIGEEKRRAAFERAFLHDASGVLSALAIASDRLKIPCSVSDAENLAVVKEATSVLMREVRLQRLLIQDNPQQYPIETIITPVHSILHRIKDLMASHPAARGQQITLQLTPENTTLETDVGLLHRVLSNMIVNALEAGQPGDEVRVTVHTTKDMVEFAVWNRQVMPETVTMRVFQRYFSTKPGGGRGMGTYIMKLLGERLLGGKVGFTSTAEGGTTFTICLPRTFQATLDEKS